MRPAPSNRLTPESGARRMFLNRQQVSSEPRVRVRAKNDLIKQFIFHPAGKLKFGADGTVEWPFDQFTERRIRDGDVTIERTIEAEKPKRIGRGS